MMFNHEEVSPMRYAKILALFLLLIAIGVSNIQSQDNVETQQLTKIRPKDGMKMVYIPAGTFMMGTSDARIQEMLRENPDWKAGLFDDEKPAHEVYTDAFYMDAYEVTNAQYRKFVEATGHREPEGFGLGNGKWQFGFKPWQDPNSNNPNQPVVCVSWDDAKAYAEWVGASLPTDAQWEKAARGGLVGKKFTWGDEFPPRELVGNFADESAKRVFTNWSIITGYDDGYAYTAPVGKFAPNGYGLYDMAGNVWEWCLDVYEPDYYSKSPKTNPVNDNFTNVNSRVVRGGTWGFYDRGFLYYLRCADRRRREPSFTYDGLGCRCCSR
jgi:formylglycine-generating enzyme required for sulfatase activity